IHRYYYDPDGNMLREAAPDGSTTMYTATGLSPGITSGSSACALNSGANVTARHKLIADSRRPHIILRWPIGCGKLFKGVYHLYKDETYLYQS
ncbi:hypothetical protein, partial [Escherichia coli]|uniref:hypothetical protein n=1 Tax=Escherichia coli TaxID=562 RepID=UPI003F7EBFB5